MIIRGLIILLIWGISFSTVEAKEPYFHKVPARTGDSILKLLKRYKLETAECNFQKFYELNDLNSESQLFMNRSYFIPVLIYDYNGKSIRTTLGLNGWEHALRIKKYNEYILAQQLRQQTIAESNILWVPYHELGCQGGTKPNTPVEAPIADNNVITSPSSTPPTPPAATNAEVDKLVDDLKALAIKESDAEKAKRAKEQESATRILPDEKLKLENNISGYRKFPIFGKKHAYIPQVDNKLRGKVFYVVSGHGGPDSGAVGKYGKHQLCEDEYAYDVSLRLVRHLLSHGALAYMITRDPDDGLREGEILKGDFDEYCWGNYKIPRSQKTRLYQRSDAINTLYERHRKQGLKDQTVICIHIDSRSKKANTDVFFYYYPGSKSGQKLAKKLHSTFKKKYKKYRRDGKYDGTLSGRDLHMLREVKPNAVFIELGNIRNSFDQQRFIKESNREALAKWMYEGLAQ